MNVLLDTPTCAVNKNSYSLITADDIVPFPDHPQVTELSVVLDCSFFFDVQGTLAPVLDYVQQDPSGAYSPTCAEVYIYFPEI